MPLLAAEQSCLPEDLFDEPPCDETALRNWYVLHTLPRQEKCLARDLAARNISFYLPLIKRRSRSRGRLLTSLLPLFPGYLFLHASEDERRAALTTQRVVRSLDVAKQEELYCDLKQLHRLIATGAPITPEDRWSPGTEVEIRTGAMAGLRGIIVRAASGRRFVVQVNFIQRGASVLLDDFALTEVK